MSEYKNRSYLKWGLGLVLGLVLVASLGAWLLLANVWMGGFQPPEMAAARYNSKDVEGNLGGLPVRLPRNAVEFVEFDGDPGWSGKRQGALPERTLNSKLASFGFDVRYPDMAMVTSYALESEKKNQSIYRTMWLRVGVTSGEIYPKDGFLDRRFACLVYPRPTYCGSSTPWWRDDYEKLSKPEHGLTAYALKGVEPQSGLPARNGVNTKDVFVAKDAQGRVRTYIDCDNVQHEAAPCGHDFSMEYDGMHALVYLKYRRGMLPHWQDIQNKVTQVMLGFVVRPDQFFPTANAPFVSR